MPHLYLSPETDSIYLDVTAGDVSPVNMVEAAEGVILHMDERAKVVAVEVMDLARRSGRAEEPNLGDLHVNAVTDSLYFDVSAGSRAPTGAAAVADGILLHADDAGDLVAIEMMGLSRRGGLRMDDLDAPPDGRRPTLFDEIENAASAGGVAEG